LTGERPGSERADSQARRTRNEAPDRIRDLDASFAYHRRPRPAPRRAQRRE